MPGVTSANSYKFFHFNIDIEFLFDFASQGLSICFISLYLATWKLPFSSQVFVGSSSAYQEGIAALNNCCNYTHMNMFAQM
jgi:hypothetical protein